jgi:hypothetical protein
VRAEDQFHVGIVVDDLDAALGELTDLAGYRWCPVLELETPVLLAGGETMLPLRFAYSASLPRMELVQSVPGTPWVPAAGSGAHHVGFWCDDLVADGRLLDARGFAVEATGTRPDGVPIWAYYVRPGRVRVELVSRELRAGLEAYWASP